MKTAQQISQEIQPHIEANNAQVGETNRRLAKIGDGQGNAQPATLLTPRDVFYRSSLDQNDRGVAILSAQCPIPIQAINGYYDTEVWVANLPGSSQVMIVDIADSAGYADDGRTPMEALANAAAKPGQDNLLIARLAPPGDGTMSILIDFGPLSAVAYEVGDGTYAFVGTTSLDWSDPTNAVIYNPTASALASGEHRLVGIAFDPVLGQFIAIPGGTASTAETLPSAASRSEFVEADYQAIDFTGYIPCGYLYNYFGQLTPVEDDVLRQFDARLILKAMGTGGGTGDVTGPGSSTTDDIATYADTTGRIIKDSGKKVTDFIVKSPAASGDNVISAATTTTRPLALKTTDDNTTNKLLEILSSANAVLASIGATGLAVFAAINSTPVGTTTPAAGYFSALRLKIGSFFGIFTHSNAADRTYTFPDKDGTVAMTSDVPTLPTLTNHDQVIGQGTTTPTFLAPSTKGSIEVSNGADFAMLAAGIDGQGLIYQAAQTDGLYPRDILYPPNAIINGGFGLWSRQAITPATLAAYSDDTYGPDQFIILTQTAAIQAARIAGDTNSDFAGQFKQNQASAQRFGVLQPIEGYSAKSYRSRPSLFQLRIRASNSQAIRIAIVEWTGTEDSPTSDVVNDWTSSIYTTGNFFISTTTTITAVGALTPAANTWTDISLTGTPSASANNLMLFIWTEGTAAQNFTLDISQVMFVDGVDPVPWIAPNPAVESVRAQRYLQVFFSANAVNTQIMAGGITTTTTNVQFDYFPPTPFRATPSLVATASDWQVIVQTSGIDCTAVSFHSSSTPQGQQMNFTVAATTSGATWHLRGDAGGDRYLILTAEL